MRMASPHWHPPCGIEAKAPDGAIEAVSMQGAPAYVLGVQWHPEMEIRRDTVSRAIFASFGNALAAAQQT